MRVSININRLPRLVDPFVDSTLKAESTITLSVTFSTFRLYLFIGKGTL